MTTKKFKSLQEPKGIWVCEWFYNNKWVALTILDGPTRDSQNGIRFRRYIPAPARKTRKK